MSVSVGPAVDIDLAALVAGGDAFVTRMNELATAKQGAEEALKALNLGKAAADAQKEAQATLDAAQKKRDDAMAALAVEIKAGQDKFAAWNEQAMASVNALLADAENQNKAAAEALSSAQQDRANATARLSEATDRANGIVNAAERSAADMKAKAEAVLADAQAAAAGITAAAQEAADAAAAEQERLKAELVTSLDAAKASESKFNQKLAAIKAVAG